MDGDGRAVAGPTRVLSSDTSSQVGDLVVLSDGTVVAAHHELTVRGRLVDAPRLRVSRSTDGGATLGPAILVAEPFRADSPSLAADASAGPGRDRVYLASAGTRPDGSRAIFVQASAAASATTGAIRAWRWSSAR